MLVKMSRKQVFYSEKLRNEDKVTNFGTIVGFPPQIFSFAPDVTRIRLRNQLELLSKFL